MKYSPLFALLVLLVMLTSACQTDDAALERVKSAMSSYQAGDGSAFDRQLTPILRQSSAGCPGGLYYGCAQLAYKNFASEQQGASQSPQFFTFFPYENQTSPSIRMVLVEGDWGSNLISCQVFFVLTDGSTWLIDNFDAPQAMTCQQRSEELTTNLFGSSGGLTPPGP